MLVLRGPLKLRTTFCHQLMVIVKSLAQSTHRVDVAPSRKSTNFTFAYNWRRSVARRLATSSLPPAQPECTPAPFLRFFLLGSSSRRRVVIPFGWLHPLIKPYFVGETARCLSPLLRQSPTSTLGSKNNMICRPVRRLVWEFRVMK